MTIRKITVLLLLAAFCLAGSVANGQNKKSKKELIKENAELRRTLDSLRCILEESIELSDTTTTEDTVNAAGIGFLDDDLYKNVVPGCNSDSLLSVWYLQKQIGGRHITDEIDFETANFTSDIPDEVYIENIKKMNSYIPIPFNSIVKNYVIFYMQKMPNKSAMILGLSRYYLPIFEEIFDSYNLPTELAAVSIIESALNPFAVSRANAKGIWQFMYRTAKQYDLEINSYVDERFDPIKSCHAAARYLRDAYTIFGDWALAISSYNCGSGNVNKAIRRSGSREFWDIYPYLPRETRGYVPSFVGALYLLNYYKSYNIVSDNITMPAHV
ncbi:MAG: lytic transglycosylase domain-containing protein, partial [Candidatus Egerieousia sp.]